MLVLWAVTLCALAGQHDVPEKHPSLQKQNYVLKHVAANSSTTEFKLNVGTR
jgi:hypothetical protein